MPGVEIPEPAMNHPLTIIGFVVLILLVLAAAAKKYATQTIAPAWRWLTGRDARAYAELVAEMELMAEQLETSRDERRQAEERHSREIAAMREQHSREIADMRSQYEADMAMLTRALADQKRQLVEVLAGVNATRTAVETS